MRGVKPALSQTSTSWPRQRGQPAIHGSSASSPMATDPRPGQPVPFGDQADEPVREQRPHHQVVPLLGARRALVAERQRHVAVALAQHLDRARRLGLHQGDAGAGVRGAQGGERGRYERGAAAGEGDEPDPAGPQARDRGDLLLGGGQPGEDARGVPYERLARLGQPHLAARADQQGCADGRFEGLHLLADGGLGAAQFAPRGGEGAGGGDGAQHTEMAGLDHPPSISESWIWRSNIASTLWLGSPSVPS